MPKIDVTKTELARPGKDNIDYWAVDWDFRNDPFVWTYP